MLEGLDWLPPLQALNRAGRRWTLAKSLPPDLVTGLKEHGLLETRGRHHLGRSGHRAWEEATTCSVAKAYSF